MGSWTTLDLSVAALVAFVGGFLVGVRWETWWPHLVAWLRATSDRRALSSTRARLQLVYGLNGRQAELAVTAYRRWKEGRCPFCGFERGERPRCEAQVAYVERTARTTWETRDGDAIIEGIFREEELGAEEAAVAR